MSVQIVPDELNVITHAKGQWCTCRLFQSVFGSPDPLHTCGNAGACYSEWDLPEIIHI